MKLLVLGGTVFLGRHLAEAAVAAGDEVTLFNRGRRSAGFLPQAEHLVGDRNGDVSVLSGRRFDAVIDCSGYTAAQVMRSADALGGFGRYVFVSSISVCAAFPPGQAYDETAPVLAGHEGYGEGKARAEEALRGAFADRLACVRPGLIVGPHDPTGRFTHWPLRALRGGDMLAPGRPDRPVQFIDVRDLAAWCLRLARERVAGDFHAIGSPRPMRELLETCIAVAGTGARLHWVDDATLGAAGVQPWTELPLWIPEDDPTHGGMLLSRNDRALGAGLTLRPWRDTVEATLAWARSSPASPHAVDTLKPEAETRILALLQS